jgi:hypothetical protein
VYLEGALERAIEAELDEAEVGGADGVVPERPAYEAPAPSPATRAPSGSRRPSDATIRPEDAVLDPFSVYRKGEALLREQLAALSPSHLRAIVRTYGLVGPGDLDPEALDAQELTELIVRGVRARMAA